MGVGRRLNLTDAQICVVVKNHISQAETPKTFCSATGISLYTYRSIVNGRIKNATDRERIEKIASVLGHSIVWNDLHL